MKYSFENGVLRVSGRSVFRPSSVKRDSIIRIIIEDGTQEIENNAFKNCKNLELVHVPRSVVCIGKDAFSYCTKLKSAYLWNSVSSIGSGVFSYSGVENVVIESGVKEIANSMFCGCNNLRRVYIPSGVQSIGKEAFKDCKCLQDVDIEDGLLRISEAAFQNCKYLREVWFPKTLLSIEKAAFKDSGLKDSIVIPNGVRSVETLAFDGCDALENIITGNQPFDKIKGITERCKVTCIIHLACESDLAYIKTRKIPLEKPQKEKTEQKVYHWEDAVRWCFKNPWELYLKGEIVGAPSCVRHEEVVKAVIVQGAAFISDNAFRLCNCLESVVIPESVMSIGKSAFLGCERLKEIKLPEALVSIEEDAFLGSGLKSVTIPDNVESIEREAFCNCVDLEEITLPASLQQLEFDAFRNCKNLKRIAINQDNMHYRDDGNGSILSKDSSVLHLFSKSREGHFEMPNSVKEIVAMAFSDCALSSVRISESVQIVSAFTFVNCEKLEKVIIPENVLKVENNAFSELKNLKRIILEGTNTIVEDVNIQQFVNSSSIRSMHSFN